MGAGASSESDAEPVPHVTCTAAIVQAPDPDALIKLYRAVETEVANLRKFITSNDADIIFHSINTPGSDKVMMISALCNRTKTQLQRISDTYLEKYGKSLQSAAIDDIGGPLGSMISYILQKEEALNAKFLAMAFAGKGYNINLLTDIICTHSNSELASIKEIFETENGSLDALLKKELKGDTLKIISNLFQGVKDESGDIDEELAHSQADKLYKAGVGKILGTDEDVFIEILCKSSRSQIQAINAAYMSKHKDTLDKAIRKEFHNKDVRKALQALLMPSIEASKAYSLKSTFDSPKCDATRVARILSSLDKPQMPKICGAYLATCGIALEEALLDELEGDFRKAAVTWVTGPEPSQGLELLNTGRSIDEEAELRAATLDLAKERSTLLDFVALTDAIAIERACVGAGTRDKELIEVLCARSRSHLKRIDAYYQKLFEKSLVQEVYNETNGFYRQLMTYSVLSTDEVDAMVMKQTLDSDGTDVLLLCEALAALSNKRIAAMKAKYAEKYGEDLSARLQRDLTGVAYEIITALLSASRDENLKPDEGLAKSQVKMLKATATGVPGTETTFIEVVTNASIAQLDCIRLKYHEMYGVSFEESVRGDTGDPLRGALAAIVSSPDDIYASALRRAFKGAESDDSAVARILGSNDKADMVRIAAKYAERYGETLIDSIMSHLTGNFQLACVTFVASADPILPDELRAITSNLSLDGEERMPVGPVDVPQGRLANAGRLKSTSIVEPVMKIKENEPIEDGDISDCSGGSGHSSDNPGSDDEWKMTPELEKLFAMKREAARKGNRFKIRAINSKIKALIAEQNA